MNSVEHSTVAPPDNSGTKPVKPKPGQRMEDPKPATPEPVDPKPVKPKPVNPKPVKPLPVLPKPEQRMDDPERHIDVNIEIGTPSSELDNSSGSKNMMSTSLGISLIVFCSLFVFVSMIAVLLFFANNHARSTRAIVLAKQ